MIPALPVTLTPIRIAHPVSAPLQLHSLPLFPLGTVLFPGGVLPLKVFEVRYLDMISKCHQIGAPFGVVTLTQGHEVQRPEAPAEVFERVGTLARVGSLSRPQPGLLLIQCQGLQRFRIQHHQRLRHGLWVADVDCLPDDTATPVPDDLQGCASALVQVLGKLHERQPVETRPQPPQPRELADAGWLANRWCELLPLAPAMKHRLMALDNPLVRLELVHDFLNRSGIAR